MIEWVPIKEFLVKQVDKKEYFLALDKCSHVSIISLASLDGVTISEWYSHAAKLNFPVEKTLEEKFFDHFDILGETSLKFAHKATLQAIAQTLIKIAKQHYEGGE